VKVFVAGATGAIGRQLLPILAGAGHEVIGMTRSESKQGAIKDAGAEPVVADALDADQLIAVLRSSEPEVVVHELTAIPASIDGRGFAESFAPTNRVRREGTRNLVAGAIAVGARRIVAQSIAQAYAPQGGWVKTEADPLYGDAPEVFRDTFQAVIDLEATVLDATQLEGAVLRYGNFYGPRTA
jgi:nucleoside-diphosphate-sugar epimerase